MKKRPDHKRQDADPPKGKGGRALERIRQERRARGLDVPNVENPKPGDEFALMDEEPEETDDALRDGEN